MPASKRTAKGKKVEPAKKRTAPAKPRVVKRKAATPKSPPATKLAGKPKASSAEVLRKTIVYFYLLSYCPPEQLSVFQKGTGSLRKDLAAKLGMKEDAFFSQAIPEMCRRIVAFHQDTREPDKAMVTTLVKAAQAAEKDTGSLAVFQTQMALIASLPGRAKPENRLHRNKGCSLCTAPCRYGYFTLVSDPQFSRMQAMMTAEAAKPASEQSPLGLVYSFTFTHLSQYPGFQPGLIDIGHQANLAYCLLMLGMAKSRLAMPELQLRLFQAANQEFIKRSRAS